jgi:Ca2+-binding RTX toxin-like protein
MALITARVATNLSGFNLKTLFGGDNSLQFLDNVNFTSAQGYVYADLLRAATTTTRFDIGSSGLILDGGVPTQGLATGFLSWVNGSSGFTPAFAIEGISVSALSVWNAAQTSGGADDIALLKSALWGHDTFTLSAGADRASGYDGNDTVSGGNGNDSLYGGVGIDSLLGGNGNDYLDGGEYADVMRGGAGDDVYIVNVDSDKVVETASAGTDTVRSSVSLNQPIHVERLVLTGSADNYAFGNSQSNTIYGNAGANSLRGGAGNDTLLGGAGNDTLFGEAGRDSLGGGAGNDLYIQFGETIVDTITETSTGGYDVVQSDLSYTLASHLEELKLTGSAAINGTGNAQNNVLTGNGGANRLAGGGGNDTIDGGGSSDTLTGGAGKDIFLFSLLGNPWNNLDRITDFVSVDDTIRLDNAQYAAVGADGALAAAAFRVGSAAGDASDRVIYNQSTGALYYDSDGTGIGAMLQFAQLTAGTVLTAADFVIV